MKGNLLEGLDTPQEAVEQDRPPKQYLKSAEVQLHAWVFVGLVVGTLLVLWGVIASANLQCSAATIALTEPKMLILVIVTGALGGSIHTLTSFVTFAGNRQLMKSWLPWLYLRAPIGSSLAVLVYLAYRSGVFSSGSTASCGDLYQIGLFAGLAGLFSKQVAEKLSDVVDTLFVASKAPARSDGLTPHPTVAAPGAGAVAPVEEFDETIQHVQRLLITLGHLPKLASNNTPRDNGLLDDATRAAVEAFLTERGISGQDRRVALGEEADADFWPKLLDLLKSAVEGQQ